MPNLDNIFNKFFPQSQTGSKGKFLLRMAWSVEILVALIGLCIGIIIIRGAQGATEASDLMARGISLNDLTIGMIFIIVAVVELTKIPLATAVYYSVRLSWKIIFLIGLLLVNVSTFETIVTGFERINRERTKVVDKMIVEYNSIKTQIELINDNTKVKTFDVDINNLRDQRTKINSQISEITINGQKRIQDTLNTGSNKDAIAQLQSQIDTLTNDISTLSAKKADLPNQIKKIGILKTNEKSILAEIAAIEKTIINKEKEKRIKEEKIADLIKQQSVNTSGQVDIIKNEITLAIKPLNEELEVISAKINDLEKRQKGFTLDKEDKDQKLRDLEDRKLELISNSEGTGIDDLAPDNQVFRVATWLKGWFVIDYNKEIDKINDQIFELEKQKVKSITEKSWFDSILSYFNKNSELDNEAIDKQISRLQIQISDFEKKAERALNTVEESVYADLPRGAITAAFWLWFGVLSFIISVTGTLLAFASLVMLDPRLHIIRNKRTAHWKGLSIRISKLIVLINKYVWGKIKRFRDPNVKIIEKEVVVEKEVEKIVEKPIEVEKIVEKIVEKPVEIEKIVIKEVEVPKEIETIRKEMVYVPLPTDDEELLKKGPFSAPDYDKNNKKK
jgi:archaellum component FlaF (FlaF/FlaG flagellin family)